MSNSFSNFKEDILRAAGGESIEAIVVSKSKENDYNYNSMSNEPIEVQQWEEVVDDLDYSYHTGYGGVDCHAITAWTATKVLFVACYDGSSWIESIPRNPVAHAPEAIGGG